MKVLVFGSLNIDHVYKVDHFVQPGETIASRTLELYCGGKGLNQSIAFARSGAETYHAGAVGRRDSDMLIEQLQGAGVHTEFIIKKDAPSGHAIIQTTPEGENGILLYGGANRMITEEDVDLILSHFSAGDVLVLQNEISQIPYIMERAWGMGMRIVLNPSPIDGDIFRLPLSYVEYLILNEVEGAAMGGGADLEEDTDQKSALDLDGGSDGQEAQDIDGDRILAELMQRFPDTRIVLTLGKKGSVYGYKDKICHQPIYPVKTVDTTAAGDTFTGFFMGSILKGKSVEEALQVGAVASAIAVSRSGASPSIPAMDEVELERRKAE